MAFSSKNVVLGLGLDTERLRGQCYDGCSTMMGKKSGVATTIKNELNRNALAIHCHAHALNLGGGDSIKNSKLMQNALETSLELSKLAKKSPKRESQLITIHTKGLFTENDEQNKTKTIRAFSDTRWTVRCSALVRIIQHYDELKELWKWCLKEYQDTETKARIIGVQTQMNKFNYIFGVKLAILLLRDNGNLSATLYNSKLSSSKAQSIARECIITLEKLRDNDYFLLFWKEVLTESKQSDVDERDLGRKRKASPRIEDDHSHSSIGFFHEKIEDFARQIYFEVLDLLINAIKSSKRITKATLY